MAEVKYSWPSRDETQLIGKSRERLDGIEKATGAAKYTYDVNLDNQLIVRALGSPHAHCRVKSVDTRAAEKVPGVVHVHLMRAPKKDENGDLVIPEIRGQGELIAAVAAETEGAAAEGVAQLKVEYELLDVFVTEEDLQAAEAAGRTRSGGGGIELEKEPGDDEDEDEFETKEIARLFAESKHVVEGYYGIDVITHCCLEPHGSTVEWKGDKLEVHLSTQNVSGTDDGFANSLGITADEVDVHCQYVEQCGGGKGMWAEESGNAVPGHSFDVRDVGLVFTVTSDMHHAHGVSASVVVSGQRKRNKSPTFTQGTKREIRPDRHLTQDDHLHFVVGKESGDTLRTTVVRLDRLPSCPGAL